MLRNLILIFSSLFFIAPVFARQKAPVVKLLSKASHSFGTYPEKKPKTCVFIVRNDGNAPLVFLKAETSCGCTSVTVSRRAVLPGQKGYIKVVYDGNGFSPGSFRKQISVYTNADPKRIQLEISGYYFPKDE